MSRKIPFYVVEMEIGLAGHVPPTQTICVSDTGYCRRSTDAGGVVAYPARLRRAFNLDMAIDLDPHSDQTAWAYGVLEIANGKNAEFGSLVDAGWTPDGHPLKILWGEKVVEWQGGVLNNRGTGGATYIDYDGFMKTSSGPAIVRQDYGSVIAADTRSTNVIRNSAMVGYTLGTLGSGGAMPTNWAVTLAGTTVQLISIQPSTVGNGEGFVMRVRVSGTPTGVGNVIFGYNQTGGGLTGLPFNQTATQSLYMALVAGSIGAGSNVTAVRHWFTIADVAGTTARDDQANFRNSITSTLQRFSQTSTMPASGFVPPFRQVSTQCGVFFTCTVGSPVDFTVDIACPQIEWGAVATPYILTTTVEATAGPGATNSIRNSSAGGSANGTPGTLPTNWSINTGGLTRQIVSSGTDADTGWPYIDIRLSGTSTGTSAVFGFDAANVIDATQNQSWCHSVYVRMQAGSQTGVTFQVGMQVLDATPTVLANIPEVLGALNASTSALSRSRRYISGTISNATARWVWPYFLAFFASGASLDFTVRIMAPQLEGGLIPATWISTSTIAQSRAPTFTSNGTSPPVINEPATTNYVTTAAAWLGGEATITAGSTEVPALMAGQTIWKQVKAAAGSSFSFFSVNTLPSTGITFRASIYVWVPVSFASGRSFFDVRLEASAGLTAGGSGTTIQNVDQSKKGQWQRVSMTGVLAAGNVNIHITPRIGPTFTGDTIYTTCPMVEIDTGPPSSYIQLGASPTTRTADNIYRPRNIAIDPPYASLQPVLMGVAGPWEITEDVLTVPVRDASYWLERPIKRNNYPGTGGYGGTATLKDTPRPIVLGGQYGPIGFLPVNNITPTLVDDVNLIYQINDGIGDVRFLYEGGAQGFAFGGDVTNLLTGTTLPGGYRTDKTHGFFQLGSSPVQQITCDCFGILGGPPSPRVEDLGYYILHDLAEVPTSYISDTTPAGPHKLVIIDPTGGYTAVGGGGVTGGSGVTVGLYIDPNQQMTGTQLITMLINAFSMWLVPRRDGTLALCRLQALAGTETPAALLGVNNARITRLKLPAALDPPWKRARINAYKNWTVQTSGYLGTANAAHKQVIAGPGTVIEQASLIAADLLRPNDPDVIGSSPLQSSGANSVLGLVTNMANLFGQRRSLWQVDVPYTIGTALDWGDVVKLTFPISGLTTGKVGQVVGFVRTSDPTVTLRVLT